MAQSFKTGITVDDATAASSQALATNVNGDTNNRLIIDAGGKITWGSGSATGDTTLYRDSADTLKTDDAFTAASLAVTGAFTLPTSDGSSSQVLVTDGLGTVTWQNQSGGGGSPGGSDGQVQYNNGGAFGGASSLYYDDVNSRVGIGTTSPAEELHILKDQDGDLTQVLIENLDQRLRIGAHYEAGVNQYSKIQSVNDSGSQGERLALNPEGGNVGIGTTTPAHPLHVYTGTDNRPLRVESNVSGSYIDIQDSTTTGEGYVGLGAVGNDARLIAGGDTKVTVTSGGNVGIGTTSPEGPLHIEKDLGTAANDTEILQRFESNVGSNTSYLTISNNRESAGGSSWDSAHHRIQHRVDSTDMAYVDFNPESAERGLALGTNNVERVTIDSSGNVGIGTTTPERALHVNSGTTNTSALFESTDANVRIYMQDSGSTDAEQVGFLGISDDLRLVAGGGARLTIQSDGNVGIGTTTPSYKLDVNGTGRFTGELTLDGDLVGTSNTNFFVGNDSNERILFQESSNQIFFYVNGAYRANFDSSGDFVPYTGTNTNTIGRSDLRWTNVYSDALDVGGDADIDGDLTVGGDVYVGGDQLRFGGTGDNDYISYSDGAQGAMGGRFEFVADGVSGNSQIVAGTGIFLRDSSLSTHDNYQDSTSDYNVITAVNHSAGSGNNWTDATVICEDDDSVAFVGISFHGDYHNYAPIWRGTTSGGEGLAARTNTESGFARLLASAFQVNSTADSKEEIVDAPPLLQRFRDYLAEGHHTKQFRRKEYIDPKPAYEQKYALIERDHGKEKADAWLEQRTLQNIWTRTDANWLELDKMQNGVEFTEFGVVIDEFGPAFPEVASWESNEDGTEMVPVGLDLSSAIGFLMRLVEDLDEENQALEARVAALEAG